MTETIGIGVGVIGTSSDTPRIGTKSPHDFAYWASKFIASGYPNDYSTVGPETDGTSLISWAATQIGVTFPTTYSAGVSYCSGYLTTVDQALKKRGSLLIGTGTFAITLGLSDIIAVINGRYFVTRIDEIKKPNWSTGAKLPGAIYA